MPFDYLSCYRNACIQLRPAQERRPIKESVLQVLRDKNLGEVFQKGNGGEL
ncbi:MAG: hypothetical protein KAT29_14770 [Anaerolineales bacterium]|nr:hypothetical protein [Anaerolineales bacterium]